MTREPSPDHPVYTGYFTPESSEAVVVIDAFGAVSGPLGTCHEIASREDAVKAFGEFGFDVEGTWAEVENGYEDSYTINLLPR